jgi:serine/threonine-protein kinase
VCGDGIVNGSEACEGSVTRACPPGQIGVETCLNCQFVSACLPIADPGGGGGNEGPGNGNGNGNGGPGNGNGNGGPGNDDDDD